MKLITPELISAFEALGDQGEVQDPIVVAKFFNPVGSQTWYATEYDKETNICYGYVTGMAFDEWGRFSIDEMESIRLPFGLRIERDVNFTPRPFSQVVEKARDRRIMPEQDNDQESELEQ